MPLFTDIGRVTTLHSQVDKMCSAMSTGMLKSGLADPYMLAGSGRRQSLMTGWRGWGWGWQTKSNPVHRTEPHLTPLTKPHISFVVLSTP
jgi:hypothetical protein